MINPAEVSVRAREKEDENMKFRIFLKNNADEETLDKQFLNLHQELFSGWEAEKRPRQWPWSRP